MVDKQKLLERLMATFLDELDGHVRVINEELIALEKDPESTERGERLSRLFRAAHSLKGASRAVDLPSIEQVCHRIEDVFSRFRSGELSPTPEVCSALFDAADAIESAGMQLREKAPVNHQTLAQLSDKLTALAKDREPAEVNTKVTSPSPSVSQEQSNGSPF